MSGPAPKPTALKRLAGNPGKRAMGHDDLAAPKPTNAGLRVPAYLDDRGKREWRRIVKQLTALGLYSDVDRTALAMYCQQYSRWLHAETMLELTGGAVLESEKGGLYQNPWLHTSNTAWDSMRKILAEFGMSPAARTRLKVEPPAKEPSLAEMLFEASK